MNDARALPKTLGTFQLRGIAVGLVISGCVGYVAFRFATPGNTPHDAA